MFTTNRIPHNSGMYHEQIFHHDTVVAQILSDDTKSFWYVINGREVVSPFPTVSAAKASLFPELDRLYG